MQASRSMQQMVEGIKALDLGPIKFKLMDREEGQGWTREFVEHMEAEYKRFLTLLVKYPQEPIAPTKDVDKFWHAHILDTRKYIEDCERIFGFYLHHFPYFGMRGDDDAAALARAGERTRELYSAEFGSPARRGGGAFCSAGAEAFCSAGAEAFCSAAGTTKAVFCSASQPAFCSAAGEAKAAFCSASQPAFCSAAGESKAAFCSASQPAFCSAAGESKAAFCSASQPAFCSAAGESKAAFCSASQPAFCSAAGDVKAAFCSASRGIDTTTRPSLPTLS